MSDVMRWRFGETNPVVLPVDSASVIEIGDLIWLDTDDAKPASAQADLGTEAQNQEGFHDKFAGVAMQRSRAGDTTPIRVATTGVFELDTASASYEVGALVGAVGATTLGGSIRPVRRCWSTSWPPSRAAARRRWPEPFQIWDLGFASTRNPWGAYT